MTTCTNLIGDCNCTTGCCNQKYRNQYHCCVPGYDGLIACDPQTIAQQTCLQLSDITKVDEYGNCLTSLTTGGLCNAECSQPASTVDTCKPCVCNSSHLSKCNQPSRVANRTSDSRSIADQACNQLSVDYNQYDQCSMIAANAGYCDNECYQPASTVDTCSQCLCNISMFKYSYPKCPSKSNVAIKSRYNSSVYGAKQPPLWYTPSQ